MTGAMGPVLYLLVCGCPVARDAGRLVQLAQNAGWEVCVVASPDAVKFIDEAALERHTGYPVRSRYKHPSDPDVLPPPDAMAVAPATTNTINKWAAGISDTLPLGLLVEGLGKGLPIVAAPFTNSAQAAHPVFRENLDRLRQWGVSVLCGEDFYRLHPPGAGENHAQNFPWSLVWDELQRRVAPNSP
ncbi:MAG: flavoprotein [Micromonosporaceae bacterium]|nr:flavoprotein [Micromonosporaceae bacterium]